MARASMRAKISALEEAFTDRFTDHQAFLLRKMLVRVDQINADIAEIDAKIEELVALLRGRWSDWMTSPASDAPPPLSSSRKSVWT
ncbi:hypothetical protein [Nonomuraea sp. JJY05]|uniref:hypothetical protein n=1 Tax=Nonomuraea sp. JJY05 TaxID=3350255 RepID=UPI00373E2C06